MRLFDDVTCDEISHEDLEYVMTPASKACNDSHDMAFKCTPDAPNSVKITCIIHVHSLLLNTNSVR
ncbi:hypothetical protein DPMN_026655 [Dreissena polymorpha]|uniref:Uncharacterized protein n=1 Tax=Dreissena polymorpha TaxID=45954 RepID=A0A9D4LVM1_DREPO|nr:hypothetical protein DPMN_026655 [Dreissena polymorpha]